MKEYKFITQTGVLIKAVSLDDLIHKLCASSVFTSDMTVSNCMETYAKQVPHFKIPTDNERDFINTLIRFRLLTYLPESEGG